jgi:hypothetical protein
MGMPVLAGLMIGMAVAGGPPSASEGSSKSAPPRSRAEIAVFRSDFVLMNWALRFFDLDGDVALSPSKVTAAAAAFRKVADKDGDGRVTKAEYRAARRFIRTRY